MAMSMWTCVLPAVSALLALLHVAGIEVLPGPCLVTLCVMQSFTVMNMVTARPSKGSKVAPSVLACWVQACETRSREAMPARGSPAWPAVGFALVVALARGLRVAGCLGSLTQVAGLACACGGLAFVVYALVLCFSSEAFADVPQHAERCSCWCQQEVTCQAGTRCPYHREFWPSMEEDAEEQVGEVVEEEVEGPMSTFLADLCCCKDDLFEHKLSEVLPLEHLAERESRALLDFAVHLCS